MSQGSLPPPSVPPLLRRWPLETLTRVAAIVGIIALSIMMYGVLVPDPLPIVLSMSAGQVLGAFALACYLLAILGDVSRRRSGAPSSRPPPASH